MVVPLGCAKMKEFNTAKTTYIEPQEMGLKTTIKVVSGNIIETVRNSRFNVVVLLTKHPYFGDLGLNEFNRLVYWNGKPIDDNQLSRMSTWMEAVYDVRPSVQLMLECCNQVAEDKKYNPLAQYFEGKRWDEVKRLEFLLEDYFGAQPSTINRAYSKKFFIGAIRRALFSTMEKPVKHDSVLVLFGKQGLKKSTSIEILALCQEWFGDTPLDITNKDYVLHLNGRLLYEMKEMAKRAKDKKLEKAFLDQKIDSLRLPYGRIRIDIPRRTSFIATTNRLDILNDATGSRRWWPVMCGYYWDKNGDMEAWPKKKRIDIQGLKKIKDQIWLEALHYAKKEEEIHWLTDEEEAGREDGREAFTSLHPLTPIVMGIVKDMASQGKKHFLPEEIIERMNIPTNQRDFILKNTIESILLEKGYSKKKERVPNHAGTTGPIWRWSHG